MVFDRHRRIVDSLPPEEATMAVHASRTSRSRSPGVPTGWLTSKSTKPLVNRPSQAGGPGEAPTMRHANYVGRHGALVVLLGTGVAVAAMPGITLAEPNSGSSTSSSDSSSASSSSGSSSSWSSSSNSASSSSPADSASSSSSSDRHRRHPRRCQRLRPLPPACRRRARRSTRRRRPAIGRRLCRVAVVLTPVRRPLHTPAQARRLPPPVRLRPRLRPAQLGPAEPAQSETFVAATAAPTTGAAVPVITYRPVTPAQPAPALEAEAATSFHGARSSAPASTVPGGDSSTASGSLTAQTVTPVSPGSSPQRRWAMHYATATARPPGRLSCVWARRLTRRA
jgi:hypothetical protein